MSSFVEYILPYYVMSSQFLSCQVISCHDVIFCHGMSCLQDIYCHIMFCLVFLVLFKFLILTSNELTPTGHFYWKFLIRSNFVLFFQKAKAFQDFRKIQVKGGNGGNGTLSFLSLFANEYAGPDGGDGGNGGHVIIQGRANNHWFNVG